MQDFSFPSSREFSFIHSFGGGVHRPELKLGIGDDAALLKMDNEFFIAQDVLIEGVHFRRDWARLEDWVHKAFVANLSDLNAMGSRGEFCLMTLGIPTSFQGEMESFSRVLQECLQKFELQLIGGDTAKSPTLFMQLTILGSKKGPALLRSMAQPGDLVCVSGVLGGAHLGWLALEKGLKGANSYVERQVRGFFPDGLGLKLGALERCACIDLSDSLYQSLDWLAKQGGVKLKIDYKKIPQVSVTEIDFAGELSSGWALEAAEDYELLVAFSPQEEEGQKLLNEGVLTQIGEVEEGEAKVEVWGKNGEIFKTSTGFQHF